MHKASAAGLQLHDECKLLSALGADLVKVKVLCITHDVQHFTAFFEQLPGYFCCICPCSVTELD